MSIFGAGLSKEAVAAAQLPLPTSLGGTRVLIDGRSAALFFVSPGQINLRTPWTTKTFERVSVRVESDGVSSPTVDIDAYDNYPRALQIPLGGNQIAAAVHALSWELVTPNNAAKPGEVITLYATGLGRARSDLPAGTPHGLSVVPPGFPTAGSPEG